MRGGSEASNETAFSRAWTHAELVTGQEPRESRIGSEFVNEVRDMWKNINTDGGHSSRKDIEENNAPVVILGTGWIGRALANRLVRAGVPTIMGSRNPDRFNLNPKQSFSVDCQIIALADAVKMAKRILVLAIPVEGHAKFAEQYGSSLSPGVTVVDVSNDRQPGAAGKLCTLLPQVKIVKAFNTVAAYHLQQEGQLPAPVMTSGDTVGKDELQKSILKPLGFSFVDLGGAESMSQQERIPMRFFDKWQSAAIVSTVLFTFWLVYAIFWFVVWPTPAQFPGDKNAGKPMYGPDGIPLSVMNKVFALTGFSLLGITYLPGCIAALLQLARGTAQCPFPLLLGTWLNIRKYLGLLSLWFIANHVFLSCLRLSRDYAYYPLYNHADEPNPGAGTEKTVMTWAGEACMLVGVMSCTLFCIIGITSLPSVSAGLSWREFQFVQSTLGGLGLLLGFAHVFLYGAAVHLCGMSQSWLAWEFYPSNKIPPPHWTSLGIPGFVLVVRFFLSCPGVSHRLNKIRKG